MEIKELIIPILIVVGTITAVAALLGAGLATASQIFYVKENPKIKAVEEVLPGINCGACGYPGCSGYAEAVATNPEVPANLCIPGGASVIQLIGEYTGKAASPSAKRVSILRCTHDMRTGAPRKFEYEGITDCAAVDSLMQGEFTCTFACAGLGNCARICPVEAIVMENGRPTILADRCTGCALCVKTCPRDVLELGEYPGRVQVYCRNTLPAKVKRTICPSACIGCTICVKKCPYEAITMVSNVAIVDHKKCPADCPRPCIEKCPTGAILARGHDENKVNAPLLKKHAHLLAKPIGVEKSEGEKVESA